MGLLQNKVGQAFADNDTGCMGIASEQPSKTGRKPQENTMKYRAAPIHLPNRPCWPTVV
jgi:hypothetical protein